MKYQAWAWVIWIATAAIITMVARNPLYILTILVIAQLVTIIFGRHGRSLDFPIRRFGLTIVILSTIYMVLFVHVGDTVLLNLPAWPLIGGPITLEAAVEGAINGLILVTLLVVFLALNSILPIDELIRLLPTAFHDVGIVILITMTYVPETRRHLERIKQAQAIRGHKLQGIRDWQPIIIPLLIGGLERSMRLAETMVARGYGATQAKESNRIDKTLTLVALTGALAGWILAILMGWPGWLLMLLAIGAIGLILFRQGARQKRNRYIKADWHIQDGLMILVAIFALVLVFWPLPWIDQSTLAYSAFPRFTLPGYDWRLGLGLAALALPAIIPLMSSRELIRNDPD